MYNKVEEEIKSIGYERDKIYIKKELSVAEKDERRKAIKESIIISTLDASPPSKKAMELMDKYIDGELELSKALEIIIDEYKKLGKN